MEPELIQDDPPVKGGRRASQFLPWIVAISKAGDGLWYKWPHKLTPAAASGAAGYVRDGAHGYDMSATARTIDGKGHLWARIEYMPRGNSDE